MSTLALSLKLSAIKTLSAVQRAINILKSAGPGAWYDPSDLTQAKATWRRNLLTETEFRNGVTDAPVRGGLLTATTLAGYAGALAFGYDGSTSTYAYKNGTAPLGVTCVMSAIVEMTDGLPPSFGSAVGGSPANDFLLLAQGGLPSTTTYTVSLVSAGVYRVSAPFTGNGAAGDLFGVVKYAVNSSRTFKVTGYQLEVGTTASTYQRITDYNTEFLAAFPSHALYQDSAGTTPVTAVEQPVGLILDKSQGLVLGPELVTNGTFDSATTSWAATSATLSATGGELVITATSTAQPSAAQAFTTEVGKTYKITARFRADASNAVAKSARIRVGSVASGGTVYSGPHEVTANGTARELTAFFTASATTAHMLLEVGSSAAYGNAGDKAYFDNISVRELPGNHLIQPTATSRPILSARKNWLLGTEVLSTQNVTTKAASHVLSFYGTGTVTLSGTSTAGPLVGTGVSDRVSLTFTPTAGTLTLTVSGSVTRAQLEYAI